MAAANFGEPSPRTTTYPPLAARPIKNTICLFDVDETLSPARNPASPEMLTTLSALRHKVAIGFVSGSNLAKAQEQLGNPAGQRVTDMFDFCFSENGLIAYKLGHALPAQSFIKWIGEDQYKELVRFILHYIADLDIPFKRGTFVEFRTGMINVSPVGRNATNEERAAYEEFDLEHRIRETFVEKLKQRFGHLGLTYSIGGKISFDIFPEGWDKTYCLRHLENDARQPGGVHYETIHFFGDKTFQGGNDYEIFTDSRTTGHVVEGPGDTIRIVKELFGV